MYPKGEDQLIGMMYVFNRRGPKRLEIGYIIDFRHYGKGYATEATQALTRLALSIDHIEKLYICCSPENKPSAKIPHKLGYELEGMEKAKDGTDLMIWTLGHE
jgi:RimJ/RimL family protein N-acetyltransferase